MKFIMAVFAAGLLFFVDSARSETWVNINGKSIEADFVRIEGPDVVLKMRGQDYNVPLDQLAPESVKKAEMLHARAASPDPTPAADSDPKGPKTIQGGEPFRTHVYQIGGTNYCVSACALMVLLDDAGIDSDEQINQQMLRQIAEVYGKKAATGRGLAWPHKLLPMLGYNSVHHDFSRAKSSNPDSEYIAGRSKSDKEAHSLKMVKEKLVPLLKDGYRIIPCVDIEGVVDHAIAFSSVTASGNIIVHDPGDRRTHRVKTPEEVAEMWYTENGQQDRLYATVIPPKDQQLRAALSWVDMSKDCEGKARDLDDIDGLQLVVKLNADRGTPVSIRIDDEGKIGRVVGYQGDVYDPKGVLTVETFVLGKHATTSKKQEMSWKEFAKLSIDDQFGFRNRPAVK